MSLNWKEINLILAELDLPGFQIQKVVQSAYDLICFHLRGRGKTRVLLMALTPGACRLHETTRPMSGSGRPLRFAEFCKSRILNGRIEAAEQLGDNRVVRFLVRQGKYRYRLYLRLWSNAANLVVTDEEGTVLDAMRRSPKRGEVTGGRYEPERDLGESPSGDPGGSGGPGNRPGETPQKREYQVRELPGPGTFNEKIDTWYTEHGGALSLEALKEQARKIFEGSLGRLGASLERLRAKEAGHAAADKLREYGDIIMANMAAIRPGDSWLSAENFYTHEPVEIKLDPRKSPAAMAEQYYNQFRKARKGLSDVRAEIAEGEAKFRRMETSLAELLAETDPLRLYRLLKTRGTNPARKEDRKRPGLSFRRGDWLIMVGRDSAENDELLRRHVRGNDLWLHVRDYPGAYVFIKQRPGKTVPLDILLDAGNLAVFYSKGRNNGEGDLFYTPVKFLRRAKNGPRGLVIPTQEKNLHIRVDDRRIKELERCRVEKN
ncbi:MAG: NFACT family protein [Spirochaetaceae bacterium]|jgi:predicted ribosome quality control (RQC) complex YloA/Tae2 family protein|nr:NFACT family protein [Spirochaetaceae bacterium]